MLADDVYNIALTLVPNLKCHDARKLVEMVGSAKFIFENVGQVKDMLSGRSKRIAELLQSQQILKEAERQLRIIKDKNINMLYFTDKVFPKKLLDCYDCPLVLYSYNSFDYNDYFTIGIVGTRKADANAKKFIYSFVEKLKSENRKILVVSGLAEGADTFAHSACLDFKLPTLAVLGHGFDRIYPRKNRDLANSIFTSGGVLVTEFYWGYPMFGVNFLQRNRILAGLCDAVIVVQSGLAGGSLNTAELANAYCRDVFAVPGRFDDSLSLGCNNLIKTNKAAILTSFNDFKYYMGW